MDSQDPSSWRRLPGPGEPSPHEAGAGSRDRGIRHVRRLSNWTAAALVAATAVTAGYFARASASAPRLAAVTRARPQAHSSRQACAAAPTAPAVPAAPVAVSGGSGVTTTVPAPSPSPSVSSSCAAGTNRTGPTVIYVHSDDGRGD